MREVGRLLRESGNRRGALAGSFAATIQLSKSCRCASAPRRRDGTGALASRRRAVSHDDRFPPHGLKRLPETDDAWFNVVGDADVDQDDMVLRMIDHAV